MTRTLPLAALCAGLVLAACVARPPVPDAPSRGDFSAELVDLGKKPGPPPGPEGACWQADIRPAVIETVTEQVMVSPEVRGPDGSVTRPATYATETRQRIVEDRGTVWFRTPCAAEMTPEFIATLQRALKARGLYLLPLTGSMDAPTRDALRRYQRARGLDSDHLSLAAARDLGIIAADLGLKK
ncbi:peptidoglycan-binding domain-containing protein [Neotabrizicola sp. VNH66]|uniref:peptidoglycan-binding domain-containing protein n=1 Tax=Neotabrizicola sp. VNH66 TaxID=3400918 RepID=UPI003C06D799